MSRTNVDYSQSRRSKRLLLNGYYQLPPGESPQKSEQSSEDDDDTASVDSNASSLYSDRAVHYNESPSILHRRRRRKPHDSPLTGGNLVQHLSESAILKRVTPKKKPAQRVTLVDNVSKDLSQTSFSKQEHSSILTTNRKETKMTITSVRSSNQRYARSEMVSGSQSLLQQSLLNRVAYNGTPEPQLQHSVSARQEVLNIHNIGEGDHSRNKAATVRFAGEELTPRSSSVTSDESQRQSVNSLPTHEEGDGRFEQQYSSTESEEDYQSSTTQYQALVPILFSKFYSLLLKILLIFGNGFSYVCRTIYQITLSIFVFDVWWLSQRTGPLLAKIIRALFLFLLLLLLLSAAYLTTRRLIGEDTDLLLVPVQSVGSVFHVLSRKLSSFGLWSSSQQSVVDSSQVESSRPVSAYPATYPELEEALSKMELQFADKMVNVKLEIAALRQEQVTLNKKRQEEFARDLISMEKKLEAEIYKLQTVSDEQTAEKLQILRNDIASMRMNHTSSVAETKAEIEQLQTLLSDRSQASTKLNEFNAKLTGFDARLTALNNHMIKSMTDFDKHVGNTTYLKEIAKMQFIESFLLLLKTDQDKRTTEDQNNLHFLFIAWLKKQGFAHIEEVDRSVYKAESNINGTITALEKKLIIHIEKIKNSMHRHHTSTLTLERIVERPMKATGAVDLSTEGQVREWIRKELDIFSADRIALADHALESAGGYVVSTRCSESYNRKTALVSLFGIPIYYNINTPRSVIQASTLPGECWSFQGSEGYIVIALSGAVVPTSFTLEHIPRELSPHGRIDSAPKDFKVLGLVDTSDYEGILLGKFRYEEDGPVIQQFLATVPQQDTYFTHVELRVESNWGHLEYTCVYRFRVHGVRQE